MDLGIKNKIALVTGGSRGIGAAISIALANEGVRLIIIGKTQESIEEIKKEIPNNNNVYCQIDLMSEISLSKLVNLLNENNINGLDIIVHNLGGSLGVSEILATEDDWIKVWKFNLGISININNYFLNGMEKRGWGRVVHISTAATRTLNASPAYIASKAALESYISTVSRKYSKFNVMINAVSPGLVRLKGRYYEKLSKEKPREMELFYDNHLPIGRMAEASEIASGVAFLCSDKASYVSGSILNIDGGML